MARECVRTIAGWRPRPRQARLPADKTWLTAARAAGLTPLAALMAVAHICPSHRARQTPLDGQGRRRSEWGFRRRRPARGSQRAASTHVQAATAEIFLDPAVTRFPRSLAAVSPLEGGGLFSPASHQPRRRARVSARVVTIVAALASSSLASSRGRFSASSPTTCSANRSAALLVSATRSASGGRDG